MVMTIITKHACDVCGEEIADYNTDGGGLLGAFYDAWFCERHFNEVWLVPDEDMFYDICFKCCAILLQADRLGIIQLDRGQIFYRLGYEWDNDKMRWWKAGRAINPTQTELLSGGFSDDYSA